MRARSKPAAHRHDCTEVVADFSRRMQGTQLESLRTARAMLRFRLGTHSEIPCDDERERILTAEINQRLAQAESGTARPHPGTPPDRFS